MRNDGDHSVTVIFGNKIRWIYLPRSKVVPYIAFFLISQSPGQVFRYVQRNRHLVSSVNPLLLSDATGDSSIRCLLTDEPIAEIAPASDWVPSIAPALCEVFPPRVTLLWRHNDISFEIAKWGYTIWQDGAVLERAEHTLFPDPKPSILSRLPGMKRNLPHPPDIAWALARGLPIDRVPAAGLRRNIPVIDYATVAQLDQRSLLVENTPRLYRFTL